MQKDARKIALQDAGLTEAEVSISSEKLDTENGVAIYEVDFVKGNVEVRVRYQCDDQCHLQQELGEHRGSLN